MANLKTIDNKNAYIDDCGEWDWNSQSYHYDYYTKSDMRIAYKRDGKYKRRLKINGRRMMVDCSPQPEKSQIFCIIRIFNKHQLNPKFMRKIFVLVDNERPLKNQIALFQYSGFQPKNSTKLRTVI